MWVYCCAFSIPKYNNKGGDKINMEIFEILKLIREIHIEVITEESEEE